MADAMVYGYCRVSTKSQLDGHSLEQQKDDILNEYPHATIVQEQYTGTKIERPEFSKLLKKLNDGDTLVVTKLDRFARTATEGLATIENLISRGIVVDILNMGKLDNKPASKLIRTVFLAFAEYERDIIVDRMAEGKEKAKQNPDFKEGRPRIYNSRQIDHALELLKEHSYKEVEQLTGISKSTLIRAKRQSKCAV